MNNKEKLKLRSASLETQHIPTAKPGTAAIVKEKTQKLLEVSPSAVETLESVEAVEFADGKISEISQEDKTQAPSAGFPKVYSADQIEAIRAKLLAALPPQEVMVKQIRKQLYRQETTLHKRMRKFQRSAHKHAFQLAIIVAKLRKIREYFSMLAHATYEIIKHLWLKIVHGV